jgi:hypothetical protein
MSVTMDLREFNQTLKQYAVAGKKTIVEATNKKKVGMLLTAARNCPVASEAAIMSKREQPKLIAYLLGGGYTRAQAQIYHEKLFRLRKGAIKFLKMYFVVAADALRGFKRTRRGFDARALKATAARPSLSVEAGYYYKILKSRRWTTPEKTAANAERLLKRVLDAAIISEIRDMQVYITRKLGGTAAKYSGTR